MRHLFIALVTLALGISIAHGDPTDLSDGVLIAHHPPYMCYTRPPSEGWCSHYSQYYAIHTCDEQNPSILEGGGGALRCAWFVLAQWREDKTWCGTEFGFGNYDLNLFIFLEYGPCAPGGCLEIPTAAWPGPNEGTAVATTDIPWHGNFMPVYCFSGYEYLGPGQIPIDVDPRTNSAGFGNCLIPPQEFEAECLPAMGIGMDGVRCCSEGLPPDRFPCCVAEECFMYTADECADAGGVLHTEWPDCDGGPDRCVFRACCVGEICYEVDERTCDDMGGQFYPDEPSCERSVCEPPLWACCTDCQVCTMTTQESCMDIQGLWLEGQECEPVNPCEASPADQTSWGNIKALYR